MDGKIHEHKSKQHLGAAKVKRIQRSAEASVETSRTLDLSQWREDPEEIVSKIKYLKGFITDTIRAMSNTELNRRARRKLSRDIDSASRRLKSEEIRLSYWQWNKYVKATRTAEREWFKHYED